MYICFDKKKLSERLSPEVLPESKKKKYENRQKLVIERYT